MHSTSSFSSSTGPLPPARRTHSPPRAGRNWPAGNGSRCGLLRRQTAVAPAGIAAEAEGLQVAEVACTAVVPGHDGLHLQGPLVLMGPAALAAASGASVYPDLDRAADRHAVAGAVGEYLLAALLSERIEALAAERQQLVALRIAQLVAAHQGVGALLAAGDAVEGEPCPPSAHQDPAGHALRGRWAAASQELHEHQGLVKVAHAHAPRDGVAQALVGGGGGWGHGGNLGVARAA